MWLHQRNVLLKGIRVRVSYPNANRLILQPELTASRTVSSYLFSVSQGEPDGHYVKCITTALLSVIDAILSSDPDKFPQVVTREIQPGSQRSKFTKVSNLVSMLVDEISQCETRVVYFLFLECMHYWILLISCKGIPMYNIQYQCFEKTIYQSVP